MKRGCAAVWIAAVLLSCLSLAGPAQASGTRPVHIVLTDANVALNGPWRFHVGDDARWADPTFDDSGWETVDLTPHQNAHDSDVGLADYVRGWQDRGHSGYFGYAWYRLRMSIDAPPGEPLALCGPFYVDNAYQIFVNGRLLGATGDFSSQPPTAYNNHLPRLFQLPEISNPDAGRSAVIAIRVWMGTWFVRNPGTGGIHIAPVLGTRQGAESVYQFQWHELLRGYIVDAAEAALFLALAALTCVLLRFDRGNRAYSWMAVALILLALRRANQPIFFWWQFEPLTAFELISLVLLVPTCLGAWTMAWYSWFGLRHQMRACAVLVTLTLLYVAVESVRRSWFYGVLPPWTGAAAKTCVSFIRLSFLIITVWTVVRGARANPRERWLAVPAITAVSVGLFADELTLLGIPGIWFPFGTGVSRTEYAYAAFDIAMLMLLLRRRLVPPDAVMRGRHVTRSAWR